MSNDSSLPLEEKRGRLSSLAIRRPAGTTALALLVVVLGVFFAGRLPVDLLPQVDYPQVRIVVNYPGVTPEVIEEQITRVLERNLAATENITELHGRASEGRSYLDLFFEYGTDVDLALQDASRHLERARSELPPGIDPPRIFKVDPSQDPIYQLGFRSDELNAIEIRDWIDYRLIPQLLSIPGIGSVEAVGGLIREIDVVVDQERLRSYRLNLTDVSNALAGRNIDIAGGNVTSPEFDVMMRTEGRFRSAEDVENVLLPLGGGDRRIRLGEVASVNDGHREQRLFARLNGEEAVQVSIMKLPDANTVEVIDNIEARLAELDETGFIPSGVEYDPILNSAFFIRASIQSVAMAAVVGGILAMLVVLLFLGSLRQSLIVGVTLPFAIIATFSMMGLGGLTLNVMSLGGLALGVGLLLDNSIVILENIFRHRDQLGKESEEAAHTGSGEVFSAVVAATSTNLAAVVPFLLMTGLAALVFRELILTISFAIIASLVAAVTLIPMLAALLVGVRFRSGLSDSRFMRGFNRRLDRLTRGYRSVATRAVRYRYAVVAVAVGLFVGSVVLVQQAGSEFLPPVDDGHITMRFVLPSGTAPGPTHEAAMQIEGAIWEMPHVETIYTTAGGYFRGGQLSIRGGMVDMAVQLTPLSERPGYTAEQWVAEFGERVGTLGMDFVQQRIQGPRIEGLQTNLAGSDISVGIVGDELDVLDDIGQEVLAHLQDVLGLGSVELGRDERVPLLTARVDDERASLFGLSASEVGNTLRTAVDGAVPTRYVTGGAEYDVRVRLPREITGTEDGLRRIALFPENGQTVYLGDVASFDLEIGPAHIERENQLRILRVNGTVNLQESTVGDVSREVRGALTGMELPQGYSFSYGGEEETMAEANRSFLLAILLAIFLVWVVLTVQYERIGSPLVIIASLPLALIGAAGLLWLTNTPLSAPVLLGVIFLVGIVVNNAILLVEYVDNFRFEEGERPDEAAVEAGAIRLRPILMTTLTTVFGMMPLAFAYGEGAELMQPLAITVIGGLLVAAFLTLFVIPGMYVIVSDISRGLRKLVKGEAA